MKKMIKPGLFAFAAVVLVVLMQSCASSYTSRTNPEGRQLTRDVVAYNNGRKNGQMYYDVKSYRMGYITSDDEEDQFEDDFLYEKQPSVRFYPMQAAIYFYQVGEDSLFCEVQRDSRWPRMYEEYHGEFPPTLTMFAKSSYKVEGFVANYSMKDIEDPSPDWKYTVRVLKNEESDTFYILVLKAFVMEGMVFECSTDNMVLDKDFWKVKDEWIFH